jgi:hypothetical protein
MDRDQSPGFRARLVLGKFRVVKLDNGKTGARAYIDMGNSITMTMDIPIHTDVRLHDILTFYTEVPLHDPAEQTSKQ